MFIFGNRVTTSKYSEGIDIAVLQLRSAEIELPQVSWNSIFSLSNYFLRGLKPLKRNVFGKAMLYFELEPLNSNLLQLCSRKCQSMIPTPERYKLGAPASESRKLKTLEPGPSCELCAHENY